MRIKKKPKICKHYSGEYSGVSYDVKKVKKPKGKVEYHYQDSDVGSRKLNKSLFKNLVKNSEVLYNEKKKKYKKRTW